MWILALEFQQVSSFHSCLIPSLFRSYCHSAPVTIRSFLSRSTRAVYTTTFRRVSSCYVFKYPSTFQVSTVETKRASVKLTNTSWKDLKEIFSLAAPYKGRILCKCLPCPNNIIIGFQWAYLFWESVVRSFCLLHVYLEN